MANTDTIVAWLRHCEAHPAAWERGEVEIPLAQVGLSFDEAEALFDRPTLAEVRRAVEVFCANPDVALEVRLDELACPHVTDGTREPCGREFGHAGACLPGAAQ